MCNEGARDSEGTSTAGRGERRAQAAADSRWHAALGGSGWRWQRSAPLEAVPAGPAHRRRPGGRSGCTAEAAAGGPGPAPALPVAASDPGPPAGPRLHPTLGLSGRGRDTPSRTERPRALGFNAAGSRAGSLRASRGLAQAEAGWHQ